VAQKIDHNDLVTLREFMLANAIQNDALTQLLIDNGLISQEEFIAKLKELQADNLSRQRS
jgi:hypothetical protein